MLDSAIKGGVKDLDVGMIALVDGRSKFSVCLDGSEDWLNEPVGFVPDYPLGDQR